VPLARECAAAIYSKQSSCKGRTGPILFIDVEQGSEALVRHREPSSQAGVDRHNGVSCQERPVVSAQDDRNRPHCGSPASDADGLC